MHEIVHLSDVEFDVDEILEINDSNNFTMDIEVENTHYYTLGSGLVSHNSVSCLTRTTSGIEPAFLLSYKRRRKVTPGDFTAKVDFTDELGDKW